MLHPRPSAGPWLYTSDGGEIVIPVCVEFENSLWLLRNAKSFPMVRVVCFLYTVGKVVLFDLFWSPRLAVDSPRVVVGLLVGCQHS